MDRKNLLAFIVAVSLFPTAGFASDWQQYAKLMDRYYHIDQHDFNRISCRIEASALNDSVNGVRQQLASAGKQFQVVDTLDTYSLELDKASGLHFHSPTLKVNVLSEQGLANPDMTKRGIEQVNSGFDQQVTGLNNQITGLFADYLTPKPGDMTLDGIATDKGVTTVRSHKGGVSSVDTFKKNAVHSAETAPGVSIEADSQYKEMSSGKLLLQNLNMKITQGMQESTVAMSVSYQTLDTLQFPKQIELQGRVSSTPSMQQSYTTTVTFSGCKLTH